MRAAFDSFWSVDHLGVVAFIQDAASLGMKVLLRSIDRRKLTLSELQCRNQHHIIWFRMIKIGGSHPSCSILAGRQKADKIT